MIIVDEPTAGLDPSERNRFHNLLAEIGENTVVILSTHIVDDVRELCTSMAIINLGQVLLEGNPAEAIDTIKGKVWKKIIAKEELEEYKQNHQVISEKMFAGKPEIYVFNENQPDSSFAAVEGNLEHVYFSQILGEPVIA